MHNVKSKNVTFSKWHSIPSHFDKIMNSICRSNSVSSDKEVSLEFCYKWKKLFLFFFFFSNKIASLRSWRNFLEMVENVQESVGKPPPCSHVLLFVNHVWISGWGQHTPWSSIHVSHIPCLGANKNSASGHLQLPTKDRRPRLLFLLPGTHRDTGSDENHRLLITWDKQSQGRAPGHKSSS